MTILVRSVMEGFFETLRWSYSFISNARLLLKTTLSLSLVKPKPAPIFHEMDDVRLRTISSILNTR